MVAIDSCLVGRAVQVGHAHQAEAERANGRAGGAEGGHESVSFSLLTSTTLASIHVALATTNLLSLVHDVTRRTRVLRGGGRPAGRRRARRGVDPRGQRGGRRTGADAVPPLRRQGRPARRGRRPRVHRVPRAQEGRWRPSADPVEDLRRGWDLHVDFGLSPPGFYVLMFGDASSRPDDRRRPRGGREDPRRHGHRVAEAGRLRMSVGQCRRSSPTPCAWASRCRSSRADEPDLDGVGDRPRGGVARHHHRPAGPRGDRRPREPRRRVARRAARRARLLSTAEHALLIEWLDRLADARD